MDEARTFKGSKLTQFYYTAPDANRFRVIFACEKIERYCVDAGFDLPILNFVIRVMISVHANQRSRGRVIVYSNPFRCLTAFPMASRQGFA